MRVINPEVSSMQAFLRGEILSHLILFARRLKERGLKITPGRVIDAARCLEFVDWSVRKDFAEALKANLVSSREEQAVFEDLFEQFWGREQKGTAKRMVSSEEGEEGREISEEKLLSICRAEEPPADKEGDNGEKVNTGYSLEEVLAAKDFSQFPPEDTALLEREFIRLLSQLAEKESRRRTPASKGREIDFRRTLSRAVHHGGEILDLVRRRRKIKPLKVVVICDVSGSMDSSTRFILQFFFGLQRVFRKSETFVFSTRLTRITDILKRNRWAGALAAVSQRVPDWSGGTKIGQCLQLFNERFGPSLAAGSAFIILISDGWDLGSPELLDAEMKKLKRKSRRIIWMNPLAGTPGYQPLSRGMRTAWPYIDYFLPANTLKGLRAMGEVLEAKGARG